jgi:GAT domain
VIDSPHHGASAASPDQLGKLQSELDIVSMNMTIMSEMLTELKPNQESPADYKLLIDLVATCKEMQSRIVDLIGKINNDEITAELLRLNDELNNLFLRHQRYEKNRDPKTASERPSALLGAAIGEQFFFRKANSYTFQPTPGIPTSSTADQQKDSLIDLNDQAAGGNVDVLNTKFSSMCKQKFPHTYEED